MSPREARPLLIERYGNVCLRCDMTPTADDPVLAVDHIVPVARGGLDLFSNYQLLCKPCNSWKSMKVIDFRPGSQYLDIVGERDVIPPSERGRPVWRQPALSQDGLPYVSVSQAAAYFRVSEATIRRRIVSGALAGEVLTRPQGLLYRVQMEIPGDWVEDSGEDEEDGLPLVVLILEKRLTLMDEQIAAKDEMIRQQAEKIGQLSVTASHLTRQVADLEGRLSTGEAALRARRWWKFW